MKRYLRGALGGILALLAAFGWTITFVFAIAWKYGGNDKAHGVAINGPVFVAKGETNEDITQQAAEHARTAHNMTEIPPEVADKVRGAIPDEAA